MHRHSSGHLRQCCCACSDAFCFCFPYIFSLRRGLCPCCSLRALFRFFLTWFYRLRYCSFPLRFCSRKCFPYSFCRCFLYPYCHSYPLFLTAPLFRHRCSCGYFQSFFYSYPVKSSSSPFMLDTVRIQKRVQERYLCRLK